MVAYKETTEEQLLRLIEGPEGARTARPVPAAQAPTVGEGSPGPRASGNPFDGLKGWVRQMLITERARTQGDPFLWNLRLASRILWVVLAALGAYVVINLVLLQPSFKLSGIATPVGQQPNGSASSESTVQSPLRPLAEYVGAVVQRDPFTGNIPELLQPAVKTAQKRLEEMVNHLVVVGVDRGPKPTALVEDTQQGRTLVLNAGDEIRGMRVKKITSEGVLLTYEGEEFLLR